MHDTVGIIYQFLQLDNDEPESTERVSEVNDPRDEELSNKPASRKRRKLEEVHLVHKQFCDTLSKITLMCAKGQLKYRKVRIFCGYYL